MDKLWVVAMAVNLMAKPFDLSSVRLLDSPFKWAMERDAAYLLQLEPDRLLSRFRSEAGLQPKAPPYGGWEGMGVAGHTLGHYLSACSMMFASTGDERFRERVNYIVDELELCQQAHGDGYVAAIPEGRRVFSEIAQGIIRAKPFDLNGVWVPWYTLHKLFAGLLDAHRFCGNEKALRIAMRLADWAERTTANLTDEQFQQMLACEHGGMVEVLAELYARTGDERYLRLAKRFYHKAVMEPLARGVDCLPGLHGNTQVPKVIGMARLYELTGERVPYRVIAEFFWERVVKHHCYVIGGFTDGEYFGEPDRLDDRLGTNTAEVCKTYNLLKLTKHLFSWSPSVEKADYYERALYNHILASQNPDDGMMCYYVPMRPGHFKTYSTPFDSFWCCVGTGMENHARYGEFIYFHTDDELLVNLFIPSELNWSEKGVRVRLETDFPESELVRLTLSCDKPTELTISVRCPSWLAGLPEARLNGTTLPVSARPGSYLSIRRTWQTGDNLEIRLPVGFWLEPLPDNPVRAAILYGPIVLAGDLGPIDQPEPILIPALVTHGRNPSEWIEIVSKRPLTFRTKGVGRPQDVTLVPFYAMHHRRYTVYWDLLTEEQWKQREAEWKAEQERLKELEQRTVDFVVVGDEQSEREHNLQGERTSSGNFGTRRWRHATDGGWFSYDLKVDPNQPMELVVTYWGSDAGARVFDIIVDGKVIATQRLQRNKPGQFFDVTYPIPIELTKGKEKVTVRFQAHPKCIAGGVFGVRMVRAKAQ
ncbi:MAG: hypothetical protein OGMRLDGQ_002358 [Candidatus Fervidibacter sp.]